MAQLEHVRSVCASILADVSGAEQIYNEVMQISQQRDQSLRQRVVDQDDQVDCFLQSALSQSQDTLAQATQVLRSLDLTSEQPIPFSMEDTLSAQQSIDMIQDLLNLSASMLEEMSSLAERLRDERKKWWRFW